MAWASRRTSRARTRLVGAVCLAAASAALLTPNPAFAGGRSKPRPAPMTLAQLRADVARTSDRLAAATVAWERGQQQLGILVQRKISSGAAGDQVQAAARDAEQRVSALAASLYRHPVDPVLTAVFSGDTGALADVMRVRRALRQTDEDQRRDADLLGDRARTVSTLLRKQEAAALAATRLQAQLDDQLTVLQADAQASALRLQAAVEVVRRRQALAAASAFGQGATTGPGGTCSADVPAEVMNGFLPISALCVLRSAPGQRLIAPAARAFDAMSSAFTAALGTPLCITDSYRDYATQVRVFQTKPNLAATPGRSQHGLGRAVDLCGGVQVFGTAPYQWLKDNAATYGFSHPDWAEPDGSRPEPWHWEFQG